jgi:hypothetical protein
VAAFFHCAIPEEEQTRAHHLLRTTFLMWRGACQSDRGARMSRVVLDPIRAEDRPARAAIVRPPLKCAARFPPDIAPAPPHLCNDTPTFLAQKRHPALHFLTLSYTFEVL